MGGFFTFLTQVVTATIIFTSPFRPGSVLSFQLAQESLPADSSPPPPETTPAPADASPVPPPADSSPPPAETAPPAAPDQSAPSPQPTSPPSDEVFSSPADQPPTDLTSGTSETTSSPSPNAGGLLRTTITKS